MTAEYVDKSTGVVLSPEDWATSPTEVAVIGADVSALDHASPEVAALMVTRALEESRSWLAVAMKGTDPTPIAEFKAWAATIEEATRQKKLGREIELDAAEMVRRAERGIGVAVRRGQEAGQIAKRGDIGAAPRPEYAGGGIPGALRGGDLVRPDAFFSNHNERSLAYSFAEPSEEEFEEALAEAKSEGNLSQRNLARKVRGGEPVGKRPELLRKTRHHDANRIVEQTVAALEGLALGVPLIDFDQLDQSQIAAWSGSLATSLQSLNRLSRRLKELDQA